MKGIVHIDYFDNNEPFDGFVENNLIVEGAGKTIIDILTTSPSLSAIPSASSILDVSNYTIQAITFGKDAGGYRSHAHGIFNNYFLGEFTNAKVISFESTSVSSYHGAATPYFFSSNNYTLTNYKLKPKYPDPLDTRLEMADTAAVPGTPLNVIGVDAGQNLNGMYFGVTLDALVAGCYPPSTGLNWRILSSPNATSIICSGTYYGTFNLMNTMDTSGCVAMKSTNIAHGNSLGGSAVTNVTGLCLFGTSNFSSTGKVGYHVTLSGGDAGTASLYGGIYHLGLWVPDVKAMLQKGLTPPYSFDPANNQMVYRLFAKKTFNKDITYITDNGTNSGAVGYQSKAININWILEF